MAGEWGTKRQNHKVGFGFVEVGSGYERRREMGQSLDSIQISSDIFVGES